MTGEDPDGWSSTSLHPGQAPAPRPVPEEPDAISRLFRSADEEGLAAGAAELSAVLSAGSWSATRFVGPRRYRPDPEPREPGPPAPAAPPTPPGPAGPTTPAGRTRHTHRAARGARAGGPVDGKRVDGQRVDRGLWANSRTMAVASLISRVTGFLRSVLLVAAIGTGAVGDAYNAANNFPNMVYELLLGGVLSSVLVPLLVHAQERDEDDGVAYTQRLLSIATMALGALTLLAVAAAPWLAAAFVSDSSQRALTSIFATLLLPEIFFYGVGAMIMAVLNVRASFGPGAWAPVLNNVVMIATLVIFFVMPGPATLNPTSMTTAQILVLGIGTTLGIAAQALALLPALRQTGFHWHWRFRALPTEVGRLREVGVLAGWVFGYVVASQVGVTVVTKIGVAHHAFTVFTNADLLVQMPYGILVVSLLTALMPRLSRAASRSDTTAVIADLGLGARLSAVTLLPITAGLIALGAPLGITLFGHGETSIAGGELIGTALAASAFGLFPFALVMLQMRVFYAMRDARTPTLVNCAMVATKVLLVVVADRVFAGPAHIAEALTVSTSASYVVGAVLGHVLLTRRIGRLGFARVLSTCLRVGVASAIGAAVAYAVVWALRSAFGLGHLGAATGLVAGAVAGLAVLAAVLWRMRLPEIAEIRALARRGGESPAP